MQEKRIGGLTVVVAMILSFSTFASIVEAKDPYQPKIDPSDFSRVVNNPYYPLVPGTTMIFIEKDGDETRKRTVTVTHDTKTVMGVKCVVVHDVVAADGEVEEDTYDWFAQDKQGTVWYFGEATREFKGGGRVSAEGSWEAGVNGQPGIMMPAHPVPAPPTARNTRPISPKTWGR